MANVYNSQLDAFTLHHQVQEAQSGLSLLSPDGPILPALGQGLAGAVGAAISNIALYPLDLIITRLQIQRVLREDQSVPSEDEYKGLLDAAQRIYDSEGGLSGFYTGLVQATGKTISDSFFFFLAYNFFRERRLKSRGNVKSLPALEELGVGYVAGSLTKLLTTPISNIVTRKQAAAFTASRSLPSSPNPSNPNEAVLPKSPSASQIAHDILKSQGYMGFWSGYSASLVLTLNPSLTFFLFETFKRLLPRARRDNPPAAATFLMAAVSKACASAVTYPFSLAKSRAQSGAKIEGKEEKKIVDEDFSSNSERKAARSTIFSTLLTIAQNEGFSGLYSGLHLEITRGFFSHGITMIVKQVVHRFIIQLYYIMSLFVQRYKKQANPMKLIERAQHRGYEYYDLGFKRVAERMEETQRQVKEKANETAEFVAEYVQEEDDGEWRNLYGTGLARWLTDK